jgi:hypothetical protein
MATAIQQNVYELNRGIADILQFEAAALPNKANLAPSDASRFARLNTLYATRNFETLIAGVLRPEVGNLENLSPERYRRSLRNCGRTLKDTDDPALIALAELLEREQERSELLSSFQGLLLAG